MTLLFNLLFQFQNITSDSMSVIQSIPRDQGKIENDLPCETNPINLAVETEEIQSKCVDEIDNSDTKSKVNLICCSRDRNTKLFVITTI